VVTSAPISDNLCDMHDAPTSEIFENWTPLKSVSLSQFSNYEQCAIVYALRNGNTGEILKFGKTSCARARLFKNYIGGTGGSTTQRIHDNLFTDSFIEHIDIAWIETATGADAELKEKRFRAAFFKAHGHRPVWDLKD
jgi:hypothetical protein